MARDHFHSQTTKRLVAKKEISRDDLIFKDARVSAHFWASCTCADQAARFDNTLANVGCLDNFPPADLYLDGLQSSASSNMASSEVQSSMPSRSWFRKILGGLLIVLSCLVRFLFIAWATLAIYFSNLPFVGLRVALASLFLAFGVWALWRPLRLRRIGMFAVAYMALLVWWGTIEPSHDRNWRSDVTVMPKATIDGDKVKISGFRNFEYRSLEDYTVRHEEREFDLAHLTSLDFYISYWAVGPVGHTFVSFNFDNAKPLCISIETRPEEGEGFSPIASLFKQFELIYVVGDERDLVAVRTNHRNEDVFLYRIRIPAATARELLKLYLERINQLHAQPEFYHLLSNSCTINIVRLANRVGRIGRLDINHVLNGFVDQYLYSSGMVETTLPFAEFRKRSHINEPANKADGDPSFSQKIREAIGIPKY